MGDADLSGQGNDTLAPSPTGPRALRAAVAVSLCLAALFVFAPLRHAEFLNYDDHVYVTANRHTQAGLTATGIVWAFTNLEFNWHPLTWLSHMLDCQLFGLDAGAHHRTSVVLHLANGVLLLLALCRLGAGLWTAALVAGLFLLHPLHVESVAWVSERKDVLSTFFWFAALLAYARWHERPSGARSLQVCLCLALSLLAKGMAVTLPLTLLLLDYWPLRRWPAARFRDLVREKIPLLVISAAGAAMTVLAQQSVQSIASLGQVPLSVRAANALVNYATYAWKAVWPTGLVLPYPISSGHPPAARIAAALLFVGATSAAVAWLGRRRRYAVTGWLWYLVTLLPVIGLVQVGYQSTADRYTYVPLTGLFLIVAAAAAELGSTRNRRIALAAGGVLVLTACGSLARVQVGHWQNSLALFGHALAVMPDNYVAQDNLALALDEAGHPEEALRHFRNAVRLNPAYAPAHVRIGLMALRDGRLDEAEASLREAVRLAPALDYARTHLGRLLLLRGRPDEAVEQYAAAVRLRPWNTAARRGLGDALQAAGRVPEALAEYRAAAGLDPGDADAHNDVGVLLARLGRPQEAQAHLREAVRLDSRHVLARVNLGTALLQLGDAAGAREQFARAVELDPGLPLGHLRLAQALEAEGRLPEALAEFERAVRENPEAADAHSLFARALERAGRAAEAAARYRDALRLDPSHQAALGGLERLGSAAP